MEGTKFVSKFGELEQLYIYKYIIGLMMALGTWHG